MCVGFLQKTQKSFILIYADYGARILRLRRKPALDHLTAEDSHYADDFNGFAADFLLSFTSMGFLYETSGFEVKLVRVLMVEGFDFHIQRVYTTMATTYCRC